MPLPILMAAAVIWVFLTIRAVRGQNIYFRFLYVSFSLRYLFNFFHQFTTVRIYMGQSLNSLLTVTIVFVGLLITWRYLIRYKALFPIYLFMFVLTFSGVWNGEIDGLINTFLRFSLCLSIILVVVRILDDKQYDDKLPGQLATIFFIPLGMQLLSFVMGLSTNAEGDGNVSYVGGYIHEGVFAGVLLTGCALAAIVGGISWRQRTLYLAILLIGLVICNYRTAILAALPIVFAHLVFSGAKGFRIDIAGWVRLVATVAAIGAGLLLIAFLSSRLADVGTVLGGLGDLLKPPSSYGVGDRELLSGRAFIWSEYVFRTIQADLGHFLFGFGPDSWVGNFELYAHNVYISYIYEIGFVGVAFYIFMVFSFIGLALSTPHPLRGAIVSCHIAFILFSFGTMPTYNIEGVMLYGVICGYTLYHKLAATRTKPYLFRDVLSQFSVGNKPTAQFH
jgi:hypothetical protein